MAWSLLFSMEIRPCSLVWYNFETLHKNDHFKNKVFLFLPPPCVAVLICKYFYFNPPTRFSKWSVSATVGEISFTLFTESTLPLFIHLLSLLLSLPRNLLWLFKKNTQPSSQNGTDRTLWTEPFLSVTQTLWKKLPN